MTLEKDAMLWYKFFTISKKTEDCLKLLQKSVQDLCECWDENKIGIDVFDYGAVFRLGVERFPKCF